jgi:hypothetical protein
MFQRLASGWLTSLHIMAEVSNFRWQMVGKLWAAAQIGKRQGVHCHRPCGPQVFTVAGNAFSIACKNRIVAGLLRS